MQLSPTGSTTPDIVTGTISFTDVDLTDRPVASASFISRLHRCRPPRAHPELGAANRRVKRCGAAVVTQAAGNTLDGSASWSYSVPDGAFDFLGTGEMLTLTYTATVDDGHGGVVTKPLTVTVTGTNDTPKITSGTQTADITEIADTTNASTPDHATGTITFIDPDLTDAHAVTITDVGVTGKSTGLANHATVLGWLSLGTLTDSGNGVTGSRAWTFSAADNSTLSADDGRWYLHGKDR